MYYIVGKMAKKRKTAKKQVKKAKKEWFNFDRAMLFLIILALLVILKTALTPTETMELLGEVETNLIHEAEIVLATLTNGNEEVSVIDSNEVIEEKIRDLDEMEYDEIKDLVGVEDDFCIFFEDVTGDLVKINGASVGIGSDKIYINGHPCR